MSRPASRAKLEIFLYNMNKLSLFKLKGKVYDFVNCEGLARLFLGYIPVVVVCVNGQ